MKGRNRTPLLREAQFPDSSSRPVAHPIQPSVVYASHDPDHLDAQYEGQLHGYTYAREGHPNADALAARLDAMEEAEGGIVTGSGMAAVTVALLGALKAGDHVIGGDQLYGRSLRLMTETLPALGIETTLADPTDASNFRDAMQPNTKMFLVETVSNPTIRIADIVGLSELARSTGTLLAVDNTFTTPRAFQPFANGADITIHSVTKLLAGHSDATLGYVAIKDSDLRERARALSVTMGFTPSPFDCWLAERGLLSFDLRYDRAEATATRLADALGPLSTVKQVLYPTRDDHPDSALARQLLNGRGSHMVSFEIEGGRDATNALVRRLSALPFAPTLGDIGTTLSHPASSSHRALTEDARAAIGISEGFFRVSVGCDDPDTLIETFESALAPDF